MATDSGYSKRDYLRICDICGHRFHFSDLKPIGEMKFACPDDAPGMTALQISRYNARVKPIVVRPNKYAKDYAQTPIYQLSEAQIFNLIASVAPAEVRDGASTCGSAAWAAIYMAGVISDDRRPMLWDRTARTVLTRCCDYLLTRQFGSPTGLSPAGDVFDVRYGGLTDDALTWSTASTIAAGIAFVSAYQITGATEYILGADRCATYIRHVQTADLLSGDGFVEFPSGSAVRYHSGGLAASVDASALPSGTYSISAISALWFLSVLSDVRGGSTSYGDATALGSYIEANAATITEMMDDLRAFATTGARDQVTNTTRTGLSTTAPRPSYDAAREDTGGTATWTDVNTISSDDVCMALRGIYEADGLTSLVTEFVTWLRGLGVNADNAIPASYTPEQELNSSLGTFDPTACPPIDVGGASPLAAPFTEADGTGYDWSSLGLLAPIFVASAINMRDSKDAVSKSRRYTTLDISLKYLGPTGRSGLSFQPYSYTQSVTRAAKAGLIYRVAPGHYPSVRGN